MILHLILFCLFACLFYEFNYFYLWCIPIYHFSNILVLNFSLISINYLPLALLVSIIIKVNFVGY